MNKVTLMGRLDRDSDEFTNIPDGIKDELPFS